ncbi:preprotein translocase subunit SecE [Azospirillaceae bacterium]
MVEHRSPKPGAGGSSPSTPASPPENAPQKTKTMNKLNVTEFARGVRTEVARVTWPSRKETMVTTGMVFVMVVLSAVFFLIVDQILSIVVRTLFGLGG